MRYVLPNGVKVILERQKAAPVAAMQVWVNAGSADETPEEAGLAHLHEHMLFKGTARRGLGEIAREVEAHGGEINAWTSFDQTVYHLVMASSFFAEGIDILADAVRNSAFDEGELKREIEVVVEEIKRSMDSPSRQISRAMFSTAYQKHPYRLQVLGSQESVRSFTREKVLAFFRKHYTPDNLTVVVVGDVTEEQAKAEIEKAFGGDWGRKRQLPPSRADEPPQKEARFALLKDKVSEAQFSLAFPIPGIASPDVAALDVLAALLAQGQGSRLTAALKLDTALVNEVYAYAYTPRDPGLFVAGASLDAEKVQEALPALLSELWRVRETEVTPEELAVAKAMVESDAVYGKETVQGVARKLGYYETVAGGIEFEDAYYKQVAALTPAMLKDVAQRYLGPEKLTLAALFPNERPLTEEEARKLVAQAKPSTRPLHPQTLRAGTAGQGPSRAKAKSTDAGGGIVGAKLSNGATVLVKPERAVPLVAIRAVYPGGLREETEATNGISQLYSRVVTRGTATRSALDVARETDEMSGALRGNAGRNSVGLRGEFLAKHFTPAMRLFADCLNAPAFANDELEREKAALISDIRARDDNPAGAVFDMFARTLYTVHPYRFDSLGEEAAVKGMGPEALKALHKATLHPSGLTLAIVGDVDPDRALALAEELYGRENTPAPAPRKVPQEPEQREPRRAYRNLDKAQAHLVFGFLGTTVSAPERHALDVLSSVLSGQGGRLFLELRDKKSLAYSISSFSVEAIDPGYFGIYMGTSPEKVPEALLGIAAEVRKVLDTPISAQELDRAQQYLIGAHAIGLQRNGARAAIIAFDEAYGLGADAYRKYEEQIRSVTREQILEVARRVLHPSKATLAVLGPKVADVPLPVL